MFNNYTRLFARFFCYTRPTSLLRPLKEELKIDGKSSEFKPLLYG